MRLAAALPLALLCACPAAPGRLQVGAQPFGQARYALKDEREAGLLRPGKVVIVVFFATWAEAARGLLPRLEQLAGTLPDGQVELLGVALDEDQRFVEPFLRELGVTFEVLSDPGGRRTGQAATLEALPGLVVLDPQGAVRAVSGESDAAAIAEIARVAAALVPSP